MTVMWAMDEIVVDADVAANLMVLSLMWTTKMMRANLEFINALDNTTVRARSDADSV
jgi:hypothetical protein